MIDTYYFTLFAMGPYALLDGLCFCLSVVCGYWFGRLKTKKTFILSLITGVGIGILLILNDGFIKQDLAPQYIRPMIGLLGSMLGYYLGSVCK
jgi:hypothetical protein